MVVGLPSRVLNSNTKHHQMIIKLKLTTNELKLLTTAANIHNMTVEQFILEAAKNEAQQVLHIIKFKCISSDLT